MNNRHEKVRENSRGRGPAFSRKRRDSLLARVQRKSQKHHQNASRLSMTDSEGGEL